MKTKSLFLLPAFFSILAGFAQKQSTELTFSAVKNTVYARLDSVRVINHTQGAVYMLYWPDTVLSAEFAQGDRVICVGYSSGYPLGVQEQAIQKASFEVFPSYPNPQRGYGIVPLSIPDGGNVSLRVTDLQGKTLCESVRNLARGSHRFRFTANQGGMYILCASWNGETRSIRIVAEKSGEAGGCRLTYAGATGAEGGTTTSKSATGLVAHESGFLLIPAGNSTHVFQFATGIPCPGAPTVDYMGQVYNTVQVYSQCWMKENLNAGSMISAIGEQTDNGIIEKYCYGDVADSCTKYGGLYEWHEMMQYVTTEGTQGICPPGWHLPSDLEWNILEGIADSEYGVRDSTWNGYGYRGFDAAKNLKTTTGWHAPGNGDDLLGFSALAGGRRLTSWPFDNLGKNGYWWTSTQDEIFYIWIRGMDFEHKQTYRFHYTNPQEFGNSVRCLRDHQIPAK